MRDGRDDGLFLRDALAPVKDLGVGGATVTTSRNVGGTDSTSFNNAGLPGIGFAQDSIEYNSHTHHTNLDTYERVIEDDVKIATAVRRGLEAEGYTVDVAVDGDDGLWRATEAQHDLIVLDLLLPQRNGFQICTELRRRDVWTPIIVLTGRPSDGWLASWSQADAAVPHPIDPLVLSSTIADVARRHRDRGQLAAPTGR